MTKEQRIMRQTRNKRRREGFTLIEVLIVVGILALLAAFVVPQLMSRGDDAKVDLCKSLIGSSGPVATALDMYKLDMGEYPEDLKDLYEKPDDFEGDKWDAYIKNPDDLKDQWGEDLVYEKDGEFNGEGKYDLSSKGPDKEEGTDDDIKNWTED
jgi:general secretion pathway protein G